jgi:hypothetical protein
MDKAIGLKNESGREGRDDVPTKKQLCTERMRDSSGNTSALPLFASSGTT